METNSGNSMEGDIIADDFVTQIRLKVSDSMSYQLEQRIHIIINNRPKRMTVENWRKICKKVLTIKYHPLILKQEEKC